MMSVFNNREFAIFIWSFVFFIYFISRRDFRSSFGSFVKCIFQYKIILMFFLMLMYMEVVLLFLIKLSFWDLTLLKSTIYWIIGVGIFLIGNQIKKDRKRYRTLILDSLKITMIGQFIVGMYCFGFVTELILTPILVFLGMIWAYCDVNEKYKFVYKFINLLVIIYGLVVFIYSVYRISIDDNSFFTFSNIKSFVLPFILLLCYLPFLYLIALYMQYDTLFVRFKYNLDNNKDLCHFLKIRTLIHCNFSIIRLKLVSSELRVLFIKDENDIRRALHEIIRDGKQKMGHRLIE